MAFGVDRLPAAPALSSCSYVYVEATNDSLGACRMVRKERHQLERPPTCLPRQLCRAACVTLHVAHHQLQPCSLLAQLLHLTMGTPLAIACRAVHWPLRTNINLRRRPEPQPQPFPLPEPFSISQTEAGLQGKEVQLAARCGSLCDGAAALLGPAASIVTSSTVRPHHPVHVYTTPLCISWPADSACAWSKPVAVRKLLTCSTRFAERAYDAPRLVLHPLSRLVHPTFKHCQFPCSHFFTCPPPCLAIATAARLSGRSFRSAAV